MPTFALISEGVTDQVIIEKIIDLCCADNFDDDVEVNPLQPIRDATDQSANTFGGWELVLEYCETKIGDALSANDYVVVHIDTDDGEHPNYGLKLTEAGKDKSCHDLVRDASNIIISAIGNDIYDANADRFIFAIAVHCIESWLLLYFFDKHEIKNSSYRFNRQLIKSDGPIYKKEYRNFLEFSKLIRLKKLKLIEPGDSSLSIFVRRLRDLP